MFRVSPLTTFYPFKPHELKTIPRQESCTDIPPCRLPNSNNGRMQRQFCSAPDLPAEEVRDARQPLYVRVSWQQATGV